MNQLNYSEAQRQRMRASSLVLFVGLRHALDLLGEPDNPYEKQNLDFLRATIESILYEEKAT